MKKNLFVPIAVATVVGGSLMAQPTQAFGPWGNSEVHQQLIQRITQRFGLNQTEVEEVFQEFHQEKHQQRQTQFEAKLDSLIEQGKLTQEQKMAILEKHEELQQQMTDNWETFRDLSPEEKREFHEQHRAELEAWAQANNLDTSLFHQVMGRGMKAKFRR